MISRTNFNLRALVARALARASRELELDPKPRFEGRGAGADAVRARVDELDGETPRQRARALFGAARRRRKAAK